VKRLDQLACQQTPRRVVNDFQRDYWQPVVLDTPSSIRQAVQGDGLSNRVGQPDMLDIHVVRDADTFLQRMGAMPVSGDHAINRRFLSLYTGLPAREIVLDKGEHGKPTLGQRQPAFNLSHTDSWHSFAITRAGPIGVDVERLDRPLSRSLAQWLLPARESGEHPVLDMLKAHREIVAWTVNEAFVKALGCGMQNRNIGRFVAGYRHSAVSRCGHYRFAWMEWRRWVFVSVLRDPIVATFALRKDMYAAFRKEQIRFIWYR
jgi:phosphopantetheinyl transferase